MEKQQDSQREEHLLLVDQLRHSRGALCEVRTPGNDLIFVGKLRDAGENGITISPDITDLPPAIYNTEVKVNIRGAGLDLMVLGGRVGRSGDNFWTITKLRHFKSAENRTFFRQRVTAKATVLRVALEDVDAEAHRVDTAPEQVEEVIPARLRDISLGGILFGSKIRFAVDERVELKNVKLLTNELPFTFLCHILRVDDSNPDDILCGCSFEKLSEKEQDRLCRVIFVLQRNELRKRRQSL